MLTGFERDPDDPLRLKARDRDRAFFAMLRKQGLDGAARLEVLGALDSWNIEDRLIQAEFAKRKKSYAREHHCENRKNGHSDD